MNGVPVRGFAARREAVAPRPAPQVLCLPMPPGVNNLFQNAKRGRVKTDRYAAWIAEAGLKLNTQHPRPVAGNFAVTMMFTRPDNRRRDLDGLAKAPLDLLVKHGVVSDDSLCVSIWLRWSEGAPDPAGGVRVTVEAAR